MTVCKACGGKIDIVRLEKHICPKPNPDYEKERDSYREADLARRARHERLGIAEVPDPPPAPPVWIHFEVLLHDGSVLTYVIRREGFTYRDHRLLIEPATEGGWAERIFRDSIRSYRFREFSDEAAARAAALPSSPGTPASQ